MNSVDVLVIGAGPAGCMAAIGALKENPELRVVIVDKDPGERHRIGEILLTNTMMELDRFDLVPEIKAAQERHGWGRKFGFTFVHGKDRSPWRVHNSDPWVADVDRGDYPEELVAEDGDWYTMMVPRHEFDRTLLDIAIKRGAKFIPAKVKDLRIASQGEHTMVMGASLEHPDGTEEKIRPAQVVDASGQAAIIPKKIGKRVPLSIRAMSSRYTYFSKIEYEEAEKLGFYKEGSNIISFGRGWAWIARLKDDLISVGIVSDEWEGGFFKRLNDMPEAKLFKFDQANVVDYLGNPQDPDHHYRHPDYSYESTVTSGANWIAVGDAARFLDPLLSQGVTLCVSFGGLAGRTVAQVLAGERDDAQGSYNEIHEHYRAEVKALQHVISLWYRPEDEHCPKEWMKAATEIREIFDRPINSDIQSFRWVANLENVHMLMTGHKETDVVDRLLKLKDREFAD
ncbi:MAG: tryptophan 7-halogenase [Alphaproteobacteria bacterium]|nr:tryptophan 7-halogenase [Alphaproteobacteria bacterium SS10]